MASVEDELQAAQRAAFKKNAMLEVMALRRQALIKEAIQDYRAGRMTSEKLWGFVGVLSEQDKIVTTLETEIKAGVINTEL